MGRGAARAGRIMADPVFITSDAPPNRGADYAWLKQEGIRLVQQLSGAIWTDYNESDPGLTTLEQLCYALTELSYRAEFSIADLFTDPDTGRIDTRRQAIYVPRRILPSAPVTENDYRKLIIDRVPGVANAWLIPCPADPPPDAVNGLYDIAVYAPGADPCVCDDDAELLPATVLARVRRVYCGHRSLCEDVHDVHLLEPLPVIVAGIVTIGDRLSPEAILARLLFNLGNFLAPEPRRVPLKALVDAGLGADAIFNGPLLRHGFIADAELQPKATAIMLRDVVRVMTRSPGVTSVRGVSVRAGDRMAQGAEAAPIPIKPTQIPRLETQPVDGRYPIRLVRNGITVMPDPVRVSRELDRLWADQRRSYPLARQYLDYFAVPRGKFHDVAIYASIQNQFPNVYGINAWGVAQDAGTVRRAQAKQFKGYLLAFEQLLADFFAQLSQLRPLYSTDEALAQTYFYQFLDAAVPDAAPLLKAGYRAGLARIVGEGDPVVARRDRFLDLLLALYAERLDADLMPLVDESRSGPELLHAKLALLRHLVIATRRRGCGFDYLARPGPRNVAGMEIACRIELGLPPFAGRPPADLIDEIGLELVDDDTAPSIGTELATQGDAIEETFTPIASFADEADDPADGGAWIDPSAGMLRGQRVSADLLHGLAAGGDVRLGVLPGDTMTAVVCRAPDATAWRLVGRFSDRARALAAARPLTRLAERLVASFRQLHIVEHTLLRFGRGREAGEAEEPAHPPPEPFTFSFTITAVVSAPRRGHDRQDDRIGVHEVIRRNTPAHIVADICFLRTRQMIEFERLNGAWRHALRRGDAHQIAATSRRLRRFLQRVGRHATVADRGPARREER